MSGFRPESLWTGRERVGGAGGQVKGWRADILRRDRHTNQQLDVHSASHVYMQARAQGLKTTPRKNKTSRKKSLAIPENGFLCENPQAYIFENNSSAVVHSDVVLQTGILGVGPGCIPARSHRTGHPDEEQIKNG